MSKNLSIWLINGPYCYISLIKNKIVHKGGGGGQKYPKTVHMVYE